MYLAEFFVRCKEKSRTNVQCERPITPRPGPVNIILATPKKNQHRDSQLSLEWSNRHSQPSETINKYVVTI
jgi:hypothetical protein